MRVDEHPEYRRLLAAMERAIARAVVWSGIIYRSAPPKWSAGRNMLMGIGSMKSGARFNAPGSFRAVYGSTTPELAMLESLAYRRRAGLPVDRAMPLVFKAISVKVEILLDLTTVAVQADLGVTSEQLRSERWWLARAGGEEALTQALGRAAHDRGVQALLTHSAHTLDHGLNLIAFPDLLRPPSSLKVLRRSEK